MYIEPAKKRVLKINFINILFVLLLLYSIWYITNDIFFVQPANKNRIEKTITEISDLKLFLDSKLPDIDSALIIHKEKIDQQNKELEELNNLMKVFKQE